ncbi:MAG: RluA family pseudouridine synthase [Phycisphaeraceae bacterium]|nr:RluA family pseudouridine synthase [Phycisphaeraceae bacterium]
MLPIVHAADRFVVVNKPAGLLSVPGKGPDKQDCVASRVLRMFPHASGPLVVHRLDMDTSGLIVVALDADAQRDLSRQFEQREVEKAYIALVEGIVPSDSGEINAAIRLDIDRRPYHIVDPVHGAPSLTHWNVLAFETDRTRLRFVPHTGRTHQLRVHAAHIGHPIIGDPLYGRREHPDQRLMLHAAELAFRDPSSPSTRLLRFSISPEF